jgi:hypothetical protein
MSPQQYRIRVMLHAVNAEERRGFVVVPQGATVTVVGRTDSRFVTVRWEDHDLIVFEQDLIEAAEAHEAAAKAPKH